MTALQIASGIVQLVGAALFLIGLFRYRKKSILFASAAALQGKVVGLAESGPSVFVSEASEGRMAFREEENIHSGTSLAPVVEFTDPRGKVRRLRGNVASKPPRYSKGETVRLLCPADSPEKAVIDRFAEKWLFETFFFAFGLTLLAVGMVFLVL